MLERDFEIIIRVSVEDIFGLGWHLRAQQLSLDSGRIDLLLGDPELNLHLIEIKKGKATGSALDQVESYASDLASAKTREGKITAWIVAHDIPDRLAQAATGRGIRFLAVSEAECERLMHRHGIDDATLLARRRDGKVLWGGGPKRGLRNIVPNEEALAEMPESLANGLCGFCSHWGIEMASGGMQTVLHYKGVKLGGVNRRHRGGHCYISAGVVLTIEVANLLEEQGFRRMTKTQKSSRHEHIWWESPWNNVEGFLSALTQARRVVDRALMDEPD